MGKKLRKSSIDDMYKNDEDWEDYYLIPQEKKGIGKINQAIHLVAGEKQAVDYKREIIPE